MVVQDAGSVMTCLKRALKMANAAQQQSVMRGNHSTEAVALYVEILNHYLFFFDQGLDTITPSIIQVRWLLCCIQHGCNIMCVFVTQNLLELSANEMAAEACKKDAELLAFYNNTLRHIAANQQPTNSSRVVGLYSQLSCPTVP